MGEDRAAQAALPMFGLPTVWEGEAMAGLKEVLDGIMNMLLYQHAEDIDRLAAAQALGKATRIWWDEESQALRFEVID